MVSQLQDHTAANLSQCWPSAIIPHCIIMSQSDANSIYPCISDESSGTWQKSFTVISDPAGTSSIPGILKWIVLASTALNFGIAANWKKKCTLITTNMTSWHENIFHNTGPFMREIHRRPVDSPHKGTVVIQALMFWGWDKMAAISQTTFSNAFSWM